MISQVVSWVLVVEDSDNDMYLLTRILAAEPTSPQIKHARDGEAAIEILEELAEGGREALPDLILIDLNLPRVDGYDVLSYLRANDSFDKTPVIVVTSSPEETDRKKALAGGADAFFVKPFDLGSYRQLSDVIAHARRIRSERD